MGRRKIENPKHNLIFARLDNKLYIQLKTYADRNEKGMVSVVARKALEKFFLEENSEKSL